MSYQPQDVVSGEQYRYALTNFVRDRFQLQRTLAPAHVHHHSELPTKRSSSSANSSSSKSAR